MSYSLGDGSCDNDEADGEDSDEEDDGDSDEMIMMMV